jgi:hypothetical protein
VFRGPQLGLVLDQHLPWHAVLSCGRSVADSLGAHVVVSSNELLSAAREHAISRPDLAAYASFWGVDVSGRNRLHAGAPDAIVPCPTLADVAAPDFARVEALSEHMARALTAIEGPGLQ